MTDKPQLIALADLVAAAPTDGLIWTLPPLSAIVRSRFPQRQIHWPQLPPAGTSYLIAIGGGELIDRAKLWRASDSPTTTVVAIPSLWGAGAEASPVAILNHGDQKTIHVGLQYVPDLRSTWPELSASIPDDIARYACGDVWAHALESFVSPLGDDVHRVHIARIIAMLLPLPIARDPRWFEPGAQASAGQARTSVGMVHGISHTLEGPLRVAHPDVHVGHARLCATLMLPVFEYNRNGSNRLSTALAAAHLDELAVFARLRELFEPAFYAWLVPGIEARWRDILRNPLTRVNSTLVRADALAHFTAFQP